MIDDIGFLDDDFLDDEDVDLSFRAQLAGWKCLYVPNAIVHHKGNATSVRLSDTHVYYHTRNLEFVWIKSMPAGLMLRFAHHKLFQEIGSFCYLCLRHGKWRPFFQAKRDALRMAPAMWEKQRTIQARRRVPNSYIRSLMTSMFTIDFARQKIRQMIRGRVGRVTYRARLTDKNPIILLGGVNLPLARCEIEHPAHEAVIHLTISQPVRQRGLTWLHQVYTVATLEGGEYYGNGGGCPGSEK
jgi:hypothetical protein